tara:strand:- start:43 stop:282 length:240 start_codon:yes stop_codon:yes gene_type:complete
MPRDRRPEFKSQIRIKGRAMGLPKGSSKDIFKFFREIDRDFIAQGKSRPTGEELFKFIYANDNYYAEYQRLKSKEVCNN